MSTYPESDRELEDIFQRVWGEAPSDDERKAILQLREAFNIRNNDALWTIVLALRYHLTLYEDIPRKIEATVKSTLQSARDTAKAAAEEMAEDTKRELAQAVSATANDIAIATAQRAKWDAIKWASLIAAMVVITVGGLGYLEGREVGYAEGHANGYDSAQDEKARAAWANTPQGKRAYDLARAGSIDMFASCNRPGWTQDGRACFAGLDENGKASGWYMRPPKK